MEKNKLYETTFFGSLLTMTAGSIDAYSYLFHGGTFAGLQTGNIILLGIKLGQKDWTNSWHYIVSIMSFFVGTIIIRSFQRSNWSRTHENERHKLVLVYETILLLTIAFTSKFLANLIAVTLLSLTASAELQEFRQLNGRPFTPLMMTGNVRTIAETTYDSVVLRKKDALQTLKDTSMILFTFVIGAALIAIGIPIFNQFSIIIPAILIVVALIYLK
ncbi:YoaK family protein [Lactiplantibacillus plantarum]|uniref:YoaK family protein n=1 Tax=Lactiplantibacillus plantarum TaxID=1590 RepID=UPI001EDBF280|nr:YoaK family protein [Lactiplantibacillus plantarum]